MKRALVVWGGWDGHEPKACVDRFVPALEEAGFGVELVESLDVYGDPETMGRQDLVVQCWTMGELSPAQETGLANAVRAGTGLAGWHGGLCDSFRNACLYQFVTGGQFVTHPPAQVPYTVHIERPADPIVAGLDDFSVKSEQYYLQVDMNNETLATSRFVGFDDGFCEGATVPYVWKRRFGEGRVFFAGFGHAASDFDVPEAFELTRRGLLWAGKHEAFD
jgi:hypothetical protein